MHAIDIRARCLTRSIIVDPQDLLTRAPRTCRTQTRRTGNRQPGNGRPATGSRQRGGNPAAGSCGGSGHGEPGGPRRTETAGSGEGCRLRR